MPVEAAGGKKRAKTVAIFTNLSRNHINIYTTKETLYLLLFILLPRKTICLCINIFGVQLNSFYHNTINNKKSISDTIAKNTAVKLNTL
jgi:hypothetical protein